MRPTKLDTFLATRLLRVEIGEEIVVKDAWMLCEHCRGAVVTGAYDQAMLQVALQFSDLGTDDSKRDTTILRARVVLKELRAAFSRAEATFEPNR